MNKDIEKFILKNKYEEELYRQKTYNILGIDEVGRGPLAGTVVVAGVILDKDKPIYGLDDSKKLSIKKREELYKQIKKEAIICKVEEVDNYIIDEIGIAQAIRLAVKNLLENIQKDIHVEHILIDYMKIDLPLPNNILKKGDQVSNSIAAASIIAKVYRDNQMKELAKVYPNYDFENNKGYGTKKHLEALNKYGVSKIHRKSFEPIKTLVKKRLNEL